MPGSWAKTLIKDLGCIRNHLPWLCKEVGPKPSLRIWDYLYGVEEH